jgi:hypothetical protein
LIEIKKLGAFFALNIVLIDPVPLSKINMLAFKKMINKYINKSMNNLLKNQVLSFIIDFNL